MLKSSLTLTVQLLTAVVLVLFGWGYQDLSSFFQNPVRAGLAIAIFAAAVSVVFLKLDIHPLRKGNMPTGSESLQLGVLLLLSLFLLWFLPHADRRKILTFSSDYWRYLGLVCCCIGIVVRVLALKALGECFSAYVTLQPNHRLVRGGIYKNIRHPLYLSLLLLPIGVALVFASYLGGPILILAAIFVIDRMIREERLLAAHFGDEFEDYRRHTWRLLPFIL
jgi:protein-S-isoprenylcysteine O-methyltransferase Ste14